MVHGVSPQQALAGQIITAIRDYGPNVGLEVGRGELVGSLRRIEAALQSATRSADGTLAQLAEDALQVLLERERRNGTPQERSDPAEFARFTDATKRALSALHDHLTD